jgi:hypothetical protein
VLGAGVGLSAGTGALTLFSNNHPPVAQRVHVLGIIQRRSIAASLGFSALIAGILLSFHDQI